MKNSLKFEMCRALKPWFLYRPIQLIKRIIYSRQSSLPQSMSMRTSWGGLLTANPTRTIGNSILTTGLYELSVSEALFRLIRPGNFIVDAGANVGYMTLLAAKAASPGGRVLSFEPHPELFKTLEINTRSAITGSETSLELNQLALSNKGGRAELRIPMGFDQNDGISTMRDNYSQYSFSIQVLTTSLDESLGKHCVDLLKLDVEGYEFEVLQGSRCALEARRIRQIIFEDHQIENSRVVDLLRKYGYTIFSLGWTLTGPILGALDSPRCRYDAPSYLATLDPIDAKNKFAARGFRSLSSR